MFGFILNAGLSALNWALFAANGSPWSLGAGIFCGAMAIFCLAITA